MNSFFFKPALHVCCFKFSEVRVLDGQAIFPDFFSQIFPLFCVILAGFVCQRVQKSFKFQRDRDAKKQEYPKVGKAVCYTPQSPSAPISALLKVYGPARILYQCAVHENERPTKTWHGDPSNQHRVWRGFIVPYVASLKK